MAGTQMRKDRNLQSLIKNLYLTYLLLYMFGQSIYTTVEDLQVVSGN